MTKAREELSYNPDYSTPPGDLIQEYLQELGISARELGRRCGRSGKLMAEIIGGKAAVEPETALQLERVLGVHATVWSNMEAAYRLHQARRSESEAFGESANWAQGFPLKELAERNCLRLTNQKSEQVSELLRFFGVGNVKACQDRVLELLDGDYRTSDTFKNDELALAAWLRIGELQASDVTTKDYSRDAFLKALRKTRSLTVLPIEDALVQLKSICASSGVVFILEKPLNKVRASGVSRWLSPRQALIQQSLRHKSDDHFWFTFFHECAHILLHSRKEIFIDMNRGPGSANPRHEAEANAWAADFLIPDPQLKRFMASFSRSEEEVREFANEHHIAPGIVVGQLQHARALRYDEMNNLKVFYEWSED